MNLETRYRYQKTIRDLRRENSELQDKCYNFRQALSDIHSKVDEAVAEGKTVLHIVYVLRAIRSRMWK